jgi:hypothetical protein
MISELTLVGTCSRYQSLDKSVDVLLYEYAGTQVKRLVACDLVIYVKTGEVYMHDFLLLNDGNWRNAFGEVSSSLIALLPEIVLGAELIKREVIEEFLVGSDDV